MIVRLTAARLLSTGLILAVASLGYTNRVMHNVCAYASAILVMSIFWAIVGIVVVGRLSEKKYDGAFIGFWLGIGLGAGVGIMLGRKARNSHILYWILVALLMFAILAKPF